MTQAAFKSLKFIMYDSKGLKMTRISRPPAQLYSLLLVTSAALLATACATTPKANPIAQYQCDMGTQLSVEFNHKFVPIVRGGRGGTHRMEKRLTGATVTLPDATVLELPSQTVTSGFKVTNGQYTLWGKGDNATWAVGRKAIEQCTRMPTL